MGVLYDDPDPEVPAAVRLAMEAWHPRLWEAGVAVGVLMARSADADEPALKAGGYAVLACIKPEPAKERVKWAAGGAPAADAVLTIDEREWSLLTDAQRVALIDHELSHLDRIDLKDEELAAAVADNAPRWKLDDRGRPKLRSVLGDWHTGDAFAAVIARHGADAIEYRNIDHARRSAERARLAGEAERAKQEAEAGDGLFAAADPDAGDAA